MRLAHPIIAEKLFTSAGWAMQFGQSRGRIGSAQIIPLTIHARIDMKQGFTPQSKARADTRRPEIILGVRKCQHHGIGNPQP